MKKNGIAESQRWKWNLKALYSTSHSFTLRVCAFGGDVGGRRPPHLQTPTNDGPPETGASAGSSDIGMDIGFIWFYRKEETSWVDMPGGSVQLSNGCFFNMGPNFFSAHHVRAVGVSNRHTCFHLRPKQPAVVPHFTEAVLLLHLQRGRRPPLKMQVEPNWFSIHLLAWVVRCGSWRTN